MKPRLLRPLLAAALTSGILAPAASSQPADVYWLFVSASFNWRVDGNWSDYYPGNPDPLAPQLPVARFNFYDNSWGGTGNTTVPILPEARIGITFTGSVYPDNPVDLPLSAIILEETNTTGRWFRNSSGAITTPELIRRHGYVTLHGFPSQVGGQTVNLLMSNASANPDSALVDLRFYMINVDQILSVRLPNSGVIHTEHAHNRVWIMVPVLEMDEPVTITKTGPGILQFSQSYVAMPGRTETTGGLIMDGGILQSTYSSSASGGTLEFSPFGYGPVTMRHGTALRAATTGGRTYHNPFRFQGTVTLGGPHLDTVVGGVQLNSGSINLSVFAGASSALLADTTLNVLSPATINQNLSGNFHLTKDGGESLTFGGETTFPTLTIRAGAVSFGAQETSTAIEVLSGGTLGGSGTFLGPIQVRSGGTLAPGSTGPGIMTTPGNLALDTGARIAFRLNGTLPGIQHDQLVVSNGVNLQGVELKVGLGFQPARHQAFVLVDNQGTGAIPGQLRYNGVDLEEGSEFQVASGDFIETFTITYNYNQGGYTNSIALLAGGAVDLGTGVYSTWRTATFGDNTSPAGDPLNQPAGQPVSNLLFHALGMDLLTTPETALPGLSIADLSLPAISGLKLHLDASVADSVVVSGGNAIAQWHDRSGQNIVFTVGAGSPLWIENAVNGLPAIRFDGSFLETTSPAALSMTNAAHGFTGFAVAKNTGTSDQTIFRVGRGSGSTANGLRIMLARTSFQHRFLARRIDSGGFATLLSGTGTISPDTWGVDAGVINYAADKGGIYINGQLMASSDSLLGDPGPVSATDSQMFRIGNDHLDQFWRGDIAEILMYDRALGEGEILAVNSYLGAKYGVDILPGPVSRITYHFARRALLGTRLVIEGTSGNPGDPWQVLAVLEPGAPNWSGLAPVVEEPLTDDLLWVSVIDPVPDTTGVRLIRLRATLP